MMSREEMSALQVGTKIGVIGQHSTAVLTVTKRTPSQIVLSDNSRWGLKTGRKHGASEWSYESLVSEQDARERIEHIRAERAIRESARRLECVRWRDLSIDQLGRFTLILDEIQPEAARAK